MPDERSSRGVRLPAWSARSPLLLRLTRCMRVSVLTTVISLATLTIFTAGFGIRAWLANACATAIATGPSYSLNRRWTWGRRDPSHPWREVLPFWLLSFAGLVLSTILVGVADGWAVAAHMTGFAHTAALQAAHLSGFGLLWGIQFVILDRVLFGRAPQIVEPRVEELDRLAA